MRTVLAMLLLAGCTTNEDRDPGDRFIAPMHGQTSVALDARLVVIAEDMSLPPDYPLLDMFRVVDMDESGRIEGRIERHADFFEFIPRSPWDANRRYGWVIDVPSPVAHGPELTFPAILEEPAIFDTSRQLDVLGGSVDSDGRTCLVLSRMLTAGDTGEWRITLNEESVDSVVGSLLPRSDWGPNLEFVADDPGVDVMCLDFPETDTDESPTAPPPVTAGDAIRVWWGSQGPWLVELQDGPVLDVVTDLRRGVK